MKKERRIKVGDRTEEEVLLEYQEDDSASSDVASTELQEDLSSIADDFSTPKIISEEVGDVSSKLIHVSTVEKVIPGGKKMRFFAVSLSGNRKGGINVGKGKNKDINFAITQSLNNSKKNLIKLPMNEIGSVDIPIRIKYKTAIVIIKPTKGRGIIAGNFAKIFLELAGFKDISVKIIDNNRNVLNVIHALFHSFEAIAYRLKIKSFRKQYLKEKKEKRLLRQQQVK